MSSFTDTLYGKIHFDELCMSFIDKPEFQRLKYIKQLGITYKIFPKAIHTRFEHSLGTAFLSEQLMIKLKENQPELNINDRLIQIVKLAGLLHDIGHIMFSHLFDNIIKNYIDKEIPEHEDRGIELIRHMIKKYNINITKDETNLLCNLIIGKFNDKYPKFIFQIVNNSLNGIDVDKIDYLMRDAKYLGYPVKFDYKSILKNIRVFNDQICYHQIDTNNVYSIFLMRFKLHKDVYQNHKVKAIEFMICDAIRENIKDLNLEYYFNNFKWIELIDDFAISKLHDNKLLKYIDNKKFYRVIKSIKYNKHPDKYINSIKYNKKLGFKSPDIMKNITFYNKDICFYKINKKYNYLFNTNFEEYYIRN
jgi:HD superfamily phosphohydrolase